MVLGGEEGLECEICVDGMFRACLGIKYLRYVLYKSGTDEAECSRKVASGRRVAGAIGSQVNARSLQFECARVLYESLLVPVLMYGSETMIWREKMSRIRAYRWTTSEVCWVSREWIKSQMHG